MMHPSDEVHLAIEMARAGRKAESTEILLEVVNADPTNETAWMWLSGLVESLEDRIIACENVLTINPSNDKVRAYLTQLQQQQSIRTKNIPPIQPTPPPRPRPASNTTPPTKEDPLRMAERLEQEGKYKEALEVYKVQAGKTKDRQEFDRIYKQIIRIENLQREEIRHIPPALSIARLTATWPLVYFLFVILHAGFNPITHFDAILCLGLPVVLAGSFLLSVSEIRSHHVIWNKLFDEEGDGSQFARSVAAVSGWLLVIFPHAFLVLSALNRLRNFIIPKAPF